MSTIQITSGIKRSRTSALTALAALLAVGMAAVVTAAPAVAQEKMTTPTPAEKKPNILFIMGDDIGWMQPSIYHRGLAVGETPNIDRIGNEGAIFMTYYAEQSCTAGRTAFITGMQPLRVGMTFSAIPPASSARTILAIPLSPCRPRTGSRNIGAIFITWMPCKG